jgi:2-C-methyl-D-erythritol 4-phosphate cytidylyltransferase
MNIGILLAAGKSTRFDSKNPKQLYEIDNKPIISYSIDVMSECLDELVIVSNSHCAEKILPSKNTTIVINDIDCRLSSIKAALNYIENKEVKNIVIHDSARPFIKKEHIENLLISCESFLYSQYVLKIVNGLVKKTKSGYEISDRTQFIELCTPQAVDYKLYDYIFRKYIDEPNKVTCELLPILDKLEIKYNLINGSVKHLRKITTIDDV